MQLITFMLLDVNIPFCPPRHVVPAPPLKDVVRVQIETIDAVDNATAWEKGSGKSTAPCMQIDDDDYYTNAIDNANEKSEKPWVQQHAIHIYGRTNDGYSVHMQVHSSIKVVLEFPETHGTRECIYDYFVQLEKDLRLKPKRFTSSYKFEMRHRSNGWVPSDTDKTVPKKFPIAILSFQNQSEYRKVIQHLKSTPVSSLQNIPIMVAIWETADYIKSQQRFLLENHLSPGGWINVKNAKQLEWSVSSCDYEFWCYAQDIKPDDEDQTICSHTIMCFDMEVINGTRADRERMKNLGLDKFPKANEPSNRVIQISVAFEMADKRKLRFLLELDDTNVKHGEQCRETRVFEGMEYMVWYFHYEPDMFVFFRDLIVYYDPDIVMSYNGDRFDWPYLIGRMGSRPYDSPFGRFYQMGRFTTDRWESKYMKYITENGRDVPILNQEDIADGNRLPGKSFAIAELAHISGMVLTPELSGRISLDLCAFAKEVAKADSKWMFKNYTLDNLAERFLKDHKVDFTHNDIFDAWNGMMSGQRLLQILSDNPNAPEIDAWLSPLAGFDLAYLRNEAAERQKIFEETNVERLANALPSLEVPEAIMDVPIAVQRRLLGDYCMKDTLLPIRIIADQGTIMFLWLLSRVTKTAPHNIINNGQMMRVSTMFIAEAWRQGRYVNRLSNRPIPYEGATVLKPQRGYYGGTDETCKPLDPQPPLPEGYDFSGIPPEDLIQREVQAAILTLDFASLYPSIMRCHSLCPSNKKSVDEPLNAAEESKDNFLRILYKSSAPVMNIANLTIEEDVYVPAVREEEDEEEDDVPDSG